MYKNPNKKNLRKLILLFEVSYPNFGGLAETNSPGVEDHGQGDSGDPFASSHAGSARDGGAFGFQLHSEGFCNATQEHVKNAELVPVTLFCGVNDVTDVCWWQSLHPNDAGKSHWCNLWKDASKQ